MASSEFDPLLEETPFGSDLADAGIDEGMLDFLGFKTKRLNSALSRVMWPPEVAKHFPREVQRLIGYAYEKPFIGCLEMGQDPSSLLD